MEEISKDAELKKMQSQLSKFKLEAKLRRNLASEIEKQKQIALAAQSVAQEKSDCRPMRFPSTYLASSHRTRK